MLQLVKPGDRREWNAVYRLMEESFPPCERRTRMSAEVLLRHPAYRLAVEKDKAGEVNAFLACWELPGFRFLEHFAVSPARRGEGVGSRLLREWLQDSPLPPVLEVEEPSGGAEKRRVAFYIRAGLELTPFGYEQPSLQPSAERVRLRIMAFPGWMDKARFFQVRRVLFGQVYRRPGMPEAAEAPGIGRAVKKEEKTVREIAAVILREGERLLICRRPLNKSNGGLWEFPGGKVEPGETGRACAARECREELGVEIAVGTEEGEAMHGYPDGVVHIVFYNGRILQGRPRGMEGQACRWVLPSELSGYSFCPADAGLVSRLAGKAENGHGDT